MNSGASPDIQDRDSQALTAFTVDALYPAIDPVSEGFESVGATGDQRGARSGRRPTVKPAPCFWYCWVACGAAHHGQSPGQRHHKAPEQRWSTENDRQRRSVFPVDEVGNDELGRLVTALNDMRNGSRVQGEVNTAAVTINLFQGDRRGHPSTKSQRTEQQAANLEETASNMEEMTVTVRQTADTAKYANQLASGARDEAQEGAGIVANAKTQWPKSTSPARRRGHHQRR